MKNSFLYKASGCSIYPGEYVPLLQENRINKKLKQQPKGKVFFPQVNISELAGSYKIEVAFPGLNREDFFINSFGNVLSITIIHKAYGLHNAKDVQLSEFNFDCFNRKILLPENADPVFINGEYKDGILYLYIPKSTHPIKKMNTRIVIY